MRAWPSLVCALTLGVVALPAGARRVELAPASSDAILEGITACIDTTVGGAAAGPRLRQWRPAPAGAIRTDGRALMRDNVLLAVTPGKRGACLLTARGDASVHMLALMAKIERRYDARRTSDAPPAWRFPNGASMRLTAGAHDGGPTYIQLALANAKGN